MWLFLKNLLFTVLVPGTVAGYVPYLLMKESAGLPAINWNLLSLVSPLFFLSGFAIYCWCLYDFAVTGRGTPAPIDAPKRLIVKGLYRFMRNPMYVGVLSVILGWAALFHSSAVLLYAFFAWLTFHLFVIFIEEPSLRRQFGESYKNYCSKVNRWWPVIQ